MHCQHCGAELSPNDRFCPSCDSAVERRQTGDTCPSCGAPVDDSMRFCMNCGAPLHRDDEPAASPQEAPTTTIPPVPAPAAGYVPPVYPGPDGGQGPEDPKRKWIIAVIVAVVVLALAGLGIWAWVANAQRGADVAVSASESADAGDADASDDAGDGKTATDDESAKEEKSCTAAPDATLDDVSSSDATLVAKLDLEDSACGDSQYKESNVRVNIKDSAGDVIAAAVFDFAKKPITFKDGEATVSLAFNTQQYWRPVEEIADDSSMSIVWQTGQKPDGKAAADAGGALGGANISADDRERFAQIALSDQLDHDRSEASDFYDTYTNQLSSKKYNMQLDGKTWKYADIYEHFLKVKQKHPNALLTWASDYSNYTKHGNPADYYVILSGEAFNTADEATSWCSANGYTSDDCIAVDLQ